MKGFHMYQGKAYRNLESVKEEIKLSFWQRIIMLFSPKMVIHIDVFSQAEINGGKVVTTVDNETHLFLFKQWLKKKFPLKGGAVEVDNDEDDLAQRPESYTIKCNKCEKEFQADNPIGVYCPSCYIKHFGA